jgi:hypothetical protein
LQGIDRVSMGISLPDILETTTHLQIDFKKESRHSRSILSYMKERDCIAGVRRKRYRR